MRCKCAMYGCKAATYNKIGYLLNFHRFPKDPVRQKVWKKLCKNPRIMGKSNTHLWLCSQHFDRSCYINEFLKPDAVPTLKLPDAAVGLFTTYDQAKNQRETDSDSLLEADEDGIANHQQEKSAETKRKITTKKEHSQEVFQIDDDDDDCESVTFSSEDEQNEETTDEDRESPQPSCSTDIVKEEHIFEEDSKPEFSVKPALTKPVQPDYLSLPKITNIASIAENNTKIVRPSTSRTTQMSAVIDKVVEDNFEDEDDCSTFAAHVRMRMRRFEPAQKVIAQKLISDIMFMADTLQLNLGSAVVNPQAQVAQFSPVAQAAQLVQTAQLTREPLLIEVPQAENNGVVKKEVDSYAYVVDSDDDDCPVAKKRPNNRPK